MVSTGKLRILSALADGELEEYAPSLEEGTGRIQYAEAERILDGCTGAPYQTLEELAEFGVLSREFQEKEYVCPDCHTTSMRFTTACESCGSTHTVETELTVHPGCGYADEEAAFLRDGTADEGTCPECGAIVDPPEDIERRLLHVCQDCGAKAGTPAHGLRCRDCDNVYVPSMVEERLLYRYRFEEGGEEWLETQLAARETLAGSLAERGFDVTVDTNVSADGEAYAVDVLGVDELLGERVVGAVHERPGVEAAETLAAAARVADARPVLLTTSGALDADVAPVVDAQGIQVLRPDGDGLAPSYEVVGEYQAPTVFQRLTSSVTERLR